MTHATVSRLVDAILKNVGESLLVLRNYDGYPDKVTGDIDLLIPNESASVWEKLERVIHDEGWRVVQIVERPWIRTYQLSNPVADRPMFVIDVFRMTSWYTFPFHDVSNILRDSHAYKYFRVPSEEDQWLVTTTHYALHGGIIPEKYQRRAQEIFTAFSGHCTDVLSASLGSKTAVLFVGAVQEARWDDVRRMRTDMRISLLTRRLSLPKAWKLLLSIPPMFFGKRVVPGAVVLVRSDGNSDCASSSATELIKRMLGTHIYRRARDMSQEKRLPGAVAKLWIRFLLRRGTCVVLRMSDERDKTWLREQRRCIVEITNSSSQAEYYVRTAYGAEAEPTRDMNEVVDFILRDAATRLRTVQGRGLPHV